MKRRMLALLLVIVMLIGMVPTSVFADMASPEDSASVTEVEESAVETEAPEEETEAPTEEETEAPTEEPTEPSEEEAETEAPAEETEEPTEEVVEEVQELEAEEETTAPVTPADDATVYFTISVKGVLAKTSDGEAAIELPVTVKDVDKDGVLTYDEALVALHEEYCPGGYEISAGFVQKFWNVTTDPKGSYYFLKDNEPLSKGVADETSTVAQDDQLYAVVQKDEDTYSDVICYFNNRAVTVEAYKDFTLNLQGSSPMLPDGFNADNVVGAQVGVWKDGTFTAIKDAVTDSKGNVTLSFDEPGTYIVSASGSIETEIANWGGGDGNATVTVDAPLTAPYCVVTVTPAQFVTATVSYTGQGNGAFFATGVDVEVPSNLAERYGFTDNVNSKTGVSALDVLVQAHIDCFGEEFTKANATDYLVVASSGWVSKLFGVSTSWVAILVNGTTPGNATVNQAKVVDGDDVMVGIYQTNNGRDTYTWLTDENGKALNGQALVAGGKYNVTVMSHPVFSTTQSAVSGAEIFLVDTESATMTTSLGTTGSDGKCEITIPDSWEGKTVCLTANGTNTFMSLAKVTVLRGIDLTDVHLGIGGNLATIKELTLDPTFVHNTQEYTVDPLVYVSAPVARRLFVKADFPEYCTVTYDFHGVTQTFTAEQNGQWIALDLLVPGAEPSTLTLTSIAENGYTKTYTFTVSMEPSKTVLWKTDLTGESMTIGQNSEHTLSVEAGVTKDVTDNPTVSYQWYVNTTASTTGGKAVDGATKADFTIPSGELGTSYYYVVASSDGLASATSKVVEVSVKYVPKSITLTSDYLYSIPSTSSTAYGGVTYVVKQGTTIQLRALDENGDETPVIWKTSGSYGGKLDTETGIYTVTSASYTYVTAVSALDSDVTSGEKAIDVQFYAITDYYKNQTVRLNSDGQTVKTASVIGGVSGYTNWDVKYPEGVAEVTSDLSTKPASVNMNVLRPGKVELTMTLDIGPEDAPKLTDSAVINVVGVAVENAEGGMGKAYLELTSENAAPTMQLKPITEDGHTVASWTSANEAVATVDGNGLVTAHAVGTTQITATDDSGSKGGILVVVSDAQNPTFETLVLYGITSSTFKYDASQKNYTGIKLTNYNTSILTINKGTLYDSEKLDCVATYTNADGEAVSIAVPSETQTQLPGMPFGTTVVTLTLTDKADPEIKSVYTLEITRVRDTTKTLSNNSTSKTGLGLMDAKGEALSSTLYLDKAEGYLFQASEEGVKNSTYTFTNSKYYYRAFLQNGRADFTAAINGNTAYTRLRYSIDDGETWTELPQGGGNTGVITFPEAEEGKNAEVKITVQVVTDQAYFDAGNTFPEMTANKEKLMVDTTQVGTIYTLWVEQLPQTEKPKMLTATATDGDWYPAFDPDAYSYKLSIPNDSSDYPTVTFTVSEGATVKLGTKAMTADEDGKYTLALKASEQKVNVTLDTLTQTYAFSSSKRIANGADKLVDYLCINSQYTNISYGFGGEGMLSGTLKSLGNFGGYATFYFEDGITNDPTNQYGVDFYVDGNAFVDTTTGTGLGSMEPGQVWVSEDGDTWYALAGSEHYDGAIWDYTVTYTKDGTGTHWSDNYGNTDASAGNRTFKWPLTSVYFLNDLLENDTITLSGILIPSVKGIVGPDDFSTYSSGAKFGYVDTLVNGTDNPYGYNDDYKLKSSGFDLAWAVDSEGNPVNVDGKSFHYVKVVTASNIIAGAANEKSTEVLKVYRASSTGAAVGTTAAPTAITFSSNGTSYTITPEAGKQVYNVSLPMDSVSITVSGEAENIYVNNQRVAAGTATKAFDLGSGTTLVRIIAQSGDEQPVIYLLKLTSGTTAVQPAEITQQPASASYLAGMDMESLTVEAQPASKNQTLTYQWYVNSTDSYEGAVAIPDAVSETYDLGKAESVGTNYYYCVVTSEADGMTCGVSSEVAKVEVLTNADYAAAMLQGTGTQADPYQIATAEDYQTVYDLVAAGYSFKDQYLAQTKDVTLPDGWQPIGVLIDPSVGNIGTRGSNMAPFSGHLNGDGHTLTVPEGGLPLLGYVKDVYVESLNIYGPQIEGYGLVNNLEGVGLSGNAITIEKVTLKSGTKTLKAGLVGTYITTNPYGGCSGGYLVTIRDCVAEEGVVIGYTGEESMIGTFAGRFIGTIENCVSHATVYGKDYVGGIVGALDNSYSTFKFLNCTFDGTVEASGELAGGILGGGYPDASGYNAQRATIKNCSVSGSITGADKVGGIEGGNNVVVQTFANGPLYIQDNTVSATVTATDGQAVGAIIGFLKGLNRNDYVSGNKYYGAPLHAIGQVEYVDTNAAEHENEVGITYINTENGTSGLPALSIPWFRWNARMNRTDDLLGKDAATMCAMETGKIDESVDTKLVGGKSTTLKAVDANGNPIPKGSITWALANAEDAAYATVTAAGAVKTYVVAAKHNVTFIGTPKDGSTPIKHTIAIYPAVSQVEILSGRQAVNGKTLYMDTAAEQSLTLTGKLYPVDSMEGLTWKSSNTKVLKVADGVVTYVAGKGTVTITATAADGSKKAASVKIQVGSLTQSITITEPASTVLRSGKSLTLKATTDPVKPTVSGVTFQLVNKADSAYATVTAAGKVTAKTVNEPHTVQIKAVSKDAAKVESNIITLTILPKANQSLILKVGDNYVTKTTLARNVNETVDLAAYTLDVSGEVPAEEKADVAWKSSNAKVASVAEDGTVTCLKSGSATITATSGKIKATVTIKVTGLVDSITITTKNAADSLTVASGKTLALKATVAPSNAANKAVTWSITDGSDYAKISSSGVVTANKNLTGVKTITVTATAKDGSGVSDSTKVTIRPLVQGLEIKRPGASENTTLVWDMAANATVQFSAVTYPVAARKDVTWKSSNAKVASIDANGKVTCLKAGTVTITATAKDGSGKKASFKLTVVKLMKDLSIEDGIIAGGKSLTLKPVITPADTTNKKLTWSVSENTAGIKVNASGKLTTKAVKEAVTVTVTASAKDGSGVSATCEVTVYPATTKVTIVIPGGGSVPKTMAYDELLVLKAISNDGAAPIYTWKTNNKLVTVKDGNVTADPKALGKTVTITATAADGTNKSASVKVKIVAPEVPQA